jgi:hypothetical protein
MGQASQRESVVGGIVIVVDDVPLVKCMSTAARSADCLIPAFR